MLRPDWPVLAGSAPAPPGWGRKIARRCAHHISVGEGRGISVCRLLAVCMHSQPATGRRTEGDAGTSRTHLPTHRHTYSGHPSPPPPPPTPHPPAPPPPPPPAAPTPLGQAAPVDVRGISRSPRPPRLRLLTVTELLDPNPTDDFSTVPWPTAFPPKSEPTAPPWRQRAQNSSLGRTKKHAQRWKLDVPILIRTRTRAPIQLN